MLPKLWIFQNKKPEMSKKAKMSPNGNIVLYFWQQERAHNLSILQWGSSWSVVFFVWEDTWSNLVTLTTLVGNKGGLWWMPAHHPFLWLINLTGSHIASPCPHQLTLLFSELCAPVWGKKHYLHNNIACQTCLCQKLEYNLSGQANHHTKYHSDSCSEGTLRIQSKCHVYAVWPGTMAQTDNSNIGMDPHSDLIKLKKNRVLIVPPPKSSQCPCLQTLSTVLV